MSLPHKPRRQIQGSVTPTIPRRSGSYGSGNGGGGGGTTTSGNNPLGGSGNSKSIAFPVSRNNSETSIGAFDYSSDGGDSSPRSGSRSRAGSQHNSPALGRRSGIAMQPLSLEEMSAANVAHLAVAVKKSKSNSGIDNDNNNDKFLPIPYGSSTTTRTTAHEETSCVLQQDSFLYQRAQALLNTRATHLQLGYLSQSQEQDRKRMTTIMAALLHLQDIQQQPRQQQLVQENTLLRQEETHTMGPSKKETIGMLQQAISSFLAPTHSVSSTASSPPLDAERLAQFFAHLKFACLLAISSNMKLFKRNGRRESNPLRIALSLLLVILRVNRLFTEVEESRMQNNHSKDREQQQQQINVAAMQMELRRINSSPGISTRLGINRRQQEGIRSPTPPRSTAAGDLIASSSSPVRVDQVSRQLTQCFQVLLALLRDREHFFFAHVRATLEQRHPHLFVLLLDPVQSSLAFPAYIAHQRDQNQSPNQASEARQNNLPAHRRYDEPSAEMVEDSMSTDEQLSKSLLQMVREEEEREQLQQHPQVPVSRQASVIDVLNLEFEKEIMSTSWIQEAVPHLSALLPQLTLDAAILWLACKRMERVNRFGKRLGNCLPSIFNIKRACSMRDTPEWQSLSALDALDYAMEEQVAVCRACTRMLVRDCNGHVSIPALVQFLSTLESRMCAEAYRRASPNFLQGGDLKRWQQTITMIDQLQADAVAPITHGMVRSTCLLM